MADRRMFAKSIISAGKFLKMPPTSRLLYYDLGMMADDDGIVEAYTVMTQTKATEDDLRVLVSKEYVRILNEDLVAQIIDWKSNNSIRGDRYHPSIYKDLLLQIECDNQVTTKCQPSVNQMDTEVRLGKDSIGKDSIYIEKPSPIKHKYGANNNVLLTDDEYKALQDKYPDYLTKIDDLSYYIASKKVSYKSHYMTILSWARKDEAKAKPKANNFNKFSQNEYDYEALERAMEGN